MAAWFSSWFGWWQGGIWTNLAASLVWSGLVWFPTLLHLHRKIDRQHAELQESHRRLRHHLGIPHDDPDQT